VSFLYPGKIGFDILQPQAKLIGIKAFGAATEPMAVKLLDDEAQPIDFAVPALHASRHIPDETLKQHRVKRKIGEIDAHGRF
jgi:hypothetical protein